ncbi:unnamed protein product [Cochlearia groenlandica]
MGNNNATASLIEEESSKLEEINDISLETTQDKVFLASEDKYGDNKKESLPDVEDPKVKIVEEEIHQIRLVLKTDEHLQKHTSVAEEESSKIEDIPLESVTMESKQDQVFLASEGEYGNDKKEILLDGNGTQETEEQQSEELLVEDPKAENVEEQMHESGLESIDEELHKQTSVPEGFDPTLSFSLLCIRNQIFRPFLFGFNTISLYPSIEVETVCEVEVLTVLVTQSVVSKLDATEFGNEEKPCVIDETVYMAPEEEEEKMINECKEEIVLANEVVIKLDQETGLEQRTRFLETEPHELLNLDYRVEGKGDQVIPKLVSQESNAVHESGLGVYEEEKDMETRREESLKRMSRSRSLPVSQHSRVMGDSLAQQLVSKVTFWGLVEKPNTSETLLVTCVRSKKEQEATETVTETNKETRLDMRSPSFGNDLRIEEKIDESTEKTLLLNEVKSETYEATIDVEENTVMLNVSESEKARGIEMSLGLSVKPKEDRFKESKGLGDNLFDKKASLGTMKGRVRRRSKSSIFGTCLCCATSMN